MQDSLKDIFFNKRRESLRKEYFSELAKIEVDKLENILKDKEKGTNIDRKEYFEKRRKLAKLKYRESVSKLQATITKDDIQEQKEKAKQDEKVQSEQSSLMKQTQPQGLPEKAEDIIQQLGGVPGGQSQVFSYDKNFSK